MTFLRDPRYTEFFHLFNAREFFEAHEVLEDLWRETRGEERLFLQGLIQAAVALTHHSRGNPNGARRLWGRARAKLEKFAPAHGGVVVAQLIEELDPFIATFAADRHAVPPRARVALP